MYLAVDIGTSSIKIIEKDDQGTAIRWGILARKNKPFHTSIQRIDIEDVARNLKQLLFSMGTTATSAVAAIPAFLAFTLVAEAPEDKYIPAVSGTFTMSVVPLSVGRYFLAAIPNRIAEIYSEIFYQAGLRLEKIQLESSALAQHFSMKEQSILVVDIGDRSTTFTVAANGLVQYIAQTDFAMASNSPNVIMERAKKIATDFKVLNTIECGGGASLPLCVAHGL